MLLQFVALQINSRCSMSTKCLELAAHGESKQHGASSGGRRLSCKVMVPRAMGREKSISITSLCLNIEPWVHRTYKISLALSQKHPGEHFRLEQKLTGMVVIL